MIEPTSYGYTVGEIFTICMCSSQILQNLQMSFEILFAKEYKTPFHALEFSINMLTYWVFYVLLILLCIYSPNDVLHDYDEAGRGIFYIM